MLSALNSATSNAVIADCNIAKNVSMFDSTYCIAISVNPVCKHISVLYITTY